MIDGSDAPSWAFHLTSETPECRQAALQRHRSTLEETHAAQRWINRVWAEAITFIPQEAHLAAEMDQARAAHRDAYAQMLYAPISAWRTSGSADPDNYAHCASYALLFLEWEAQYPDEWREAGTWAWSPWGTKETILASFIQGGVSAEYQTTIADLGVAAVTRTYRCKDWMYARVAQAVGTDDLRGRLDVLLGAADPLVRLRAEFVLDVMEEPRRRVKMTTWQRWLASREPRSGVAVWTRTSDADHG